MKNPVCEQIQSIREGPASHAAICARVSGNVIIMNEETSVIYDILRGVMP